MGRGSESTTAVSLGASLRSTDIDQGLGPFFVAASDPKRPRKNHEIAARIRWVADPSVVIDANRESIKDLSPEEKVAKMRAAIIEGADEVFGGDWNLDGFSVYAVNGHHYHGGLTVEEGDTVDISKITSTYEPEDQFLIEIESRFKIASSDLFNANSSFAKRGLTTYEMMALLWNGDSDFAKDELVEAEVEKACKKMQGLRPKLSGWDIFRSNLNDVRVSIRPVEIPKVVV